MVGSFDGWQTLEKCEGVLLAAAGVPCPTASSTGSFDAMGVRAEQLDQESLLERTASVARAGMDLHTLLIGATIVCTPGLINRLVWRSWFESQNLLQALSLMTRSTC